MRRFSRFAVLCLSGAVACGGDDDAPSSSSTSSSSSSSSSSGNASSSSGAAASSSGGSSGGSSGASSSSGGATTTNANVTGVWSGTAGKEATYLDLTQAGTAVTGEACTQPGSATGCFELTEGAVAGDQFTAKYATATDSVTMTLKVAADGRTMQGTYAFTKCACTENATLGKK